MTSSFTSKKHRPDGDTLVQIFRVDPTHDVKLHDCAGCSIHCIKNDKYRGIPGKGHRALKVSTDEDEWTDTSVSPSTTNDEAVFDEALRTTSLSSSSSPTEWIILPPILVPSLKSLIAPCVMSGGLCVTVWKRTGLV